MYGGYDEAHFAYGSVDTINNQSSVFVPFQLKQTMRTNPTLIVQYMQVDKVRIVGRSLSAYTPSWSSHLETVVSSMATKNQILCRFIMPDTSTNRCGCLRSSGYPWNKSGQLAQT